MLTHDDIVALNPSNTCDDSGLAGLTVIVPLGNEIFQRDTIFEWCEDMPVLLAPALPKYPDLARRAGIEGRVVVEVVIDTRGAVSDAKVIQNSGANAGFEEAAVEAALRGKWRPAMQNKQPVRVRVSYPIVFKLK
jgi:protein TonB